MQNSSKMVLIGKLENFAKKERIYATRYVGMKLYMITFNKKDPLFVINLEDHRNPKIVGRYWMLGYSNYLHPVTNNVLLGFGKQANASGKDQWLKIALFDVSG